MIVVLGYAVLLKYAGWILLGAFGYLWLKQSVPALIRWRRRAHQRRQSAEAEREHMRLRADFEDRMATLGDPVGVYGHYPPATMPLTRPLPEPHYAEPRDWFDYEPNNPYHLFGGNY